MKSLSLLGTTSLARGRNNSFHVRLRTQLALPTLLCLVAGRCLLAGAPPTSVTIVDTGKDAEGAPTFQLGWTAIPKAAYLVQSTTNLSLAQSWRTVDVITPDSAQAQCTIKG